MWSGAALLDLCYEEDSQAEVDVNVVMTGAGEFVELQATGEKATFREERLTEMIGFARAGLRELFAAQRAVAGSQVNLPMPILRCATTNPGKLNEFRMAAAHFGFTEVEIQLLDDLKKIVPPEEEGESFEENAIEKALYYSVFCEEPLFADDSGLEVDSLDGEPGILLGALCRAGARPTRTTTGCCSPASGT